MNTKNPLARIKQHALATLITLFTAFLSMTADIVSGCASKPGLFNPATIVENNSIPTAEKTDQAVKALKARVDSFVMYITLSPIEQGQVDLNPGLRSLMLFTSPYMRIEPHARWSNGQPISADAHISRNETEKVIDLLAGDGFFERAGKYYSERVKADPSKYPPPADSKKYTPLVRNNRHCSIKLMVNDEPWYTYYESSLDWNALTVDRLESIGKVLNKDAAKAIGELLGAMKVER